MSYIFDKYDCDFGVAALGPNADICAATNCNLLDHFVGEVVVGEEQRRRRGRAGAPSKKEGTLKPCMGQNVRCVCQTARVQGLAPEPPPTPQPQLPPIPPSIG